MINAMHHDAVESLKNVTDACTLVVSREVLVVMPSSAATPSPIQTEPLKSLSHNSSTSETTKEKELQDMEEFNNRLATIHKPNPTVIAEQGSPASPNYHAQNLPFEQASRESSTSLDDEAVAKKLQEISQQARKREEEAVIVLGVPKEDIPFDETEEEPLPNVKKNKDYANMDIANLVLLDPEGKKIEKDSDQEDAEPPNRLSTDQFVSDDSSSSSDSDSDSDSDIVVLGPQDSEIEKIPYQEEVSS